MADGVSYPTSLSALSTASPNPRSEKVIAAGSAGASASTETSSVDTVQGSPSTIATRRSHAHRPPPPGSLGGELEGHLVLGMPRQSLLDTVEPLQLGIRLDD